MQRRLEIDAQERIVATLKRDAPYSASAVPAEELDTATSRLDELRRHEAEAARITPEQLAEMNAGVQAGPTWLDEEARLFGQRTVENRPLAPATALRRTAKKVSTTGLEPGQQAFQIGKEWTKTARTWSDVDGQVTSIKHVGRETIVEVTPLDGSAIRTYRIKSKTVDVIKNQAVRDGQLLDTTTTRYRLIEIRQAGVEPALYEEVYDITGHWVERGESRLTKGTVLEEAVGLQETARLKATVKAEAAAPAGLRDWFKVELPRQRRGFDRAFVEFRQEGKKLVAKIRVLEVKEYPGTYPSFDSFTAIDENLGYNIKTLKGVLKDKLGDLRAAGRTDLAEALEVALDGNKITVEVWHGPDTLIGKGRGDRAVMVKLRDAVNSRRGVTLDMTPKPVASVWRDKAVAARAAEAANVP